MWKWSGNYPTQHWIHWVRTHHCVGLAATGLTISENSAIESLCYWLYQMKSRFFIENLLGNLCRIDRIICKTFHSISIIGVRLFYSDWVFLSLNLQNHNAFLIPLLLIQWPYSHDNLHALTCFALAFLRHFIKLKNFLLKISKN